MSLKLTKIETSCLNTLKKDNMYDWQLEKVLRSDPYTSKLFQGVSPIDRLPKVIMFPAALIANTQPSDQEGEHWVSFYLLSERERDFFDSYGHPQAI